MNKGDILIYYGDKNKYTKYKKYIINQIHKYQHHNYTDNYFRVTDDTGINNWYNFDEIKGVYFKLEQEIRKEKLEKLNDIVK